MMNACLTRGAGRRLGWLRLLLPLVVLPVVLVLQGCVFADLRRQVAELDAACQISGSVSTTGDQHAPLVVVLLHESEDAEGAGPLPVDYMVSEHSGRWLFAAMPGEYSVVAFADIGSNLTYEASDPVTSINDGEPLTCPPGERLDIGEIVIDTPAGDGDAFLLELSRDRLLPAGEQAGPVVALGQVTAFGEVTSLDHPRFALEVARDSLWRPADFFRNARGGVYFLDAYDPARVPVLFIHGINGSPRVFTELIDSLDTDRHQVWVYYYSSGVPLSDTVTHLVQIMHELELRHGVRRLHVVAHSMGGLVGRAYVNERRRRGALARVPVFIPLSAPWGGHQAARRGIDRLPVVVPVWHDVAPGSEFLESLFAGPVDDGTAMHMLFSYQRTDTISRTADDGLIPLTSLLVPDAQRAAASNFGVDDTHVGILTNPEAMARVNALLAAADEDGAPSQASTKPAISSSSPGSERMRP